MKSFNFFKDDKLLQQPTKLLELIQNIRSKHRIFITTHLKQLYEKYIFSRNYYSFTD